MNSDDAINSRFFEAAGNLAERLLADLRRDDPDGAAATERTLKGGGLLQFRVAFGVGGVIDTRLLLIAADGSESLTLFEITDFERAQ